MLPTYLLSLREGLEAALIIGIVLGAVSKIRRKDLGPAVWFGTLSAVAVSILAALLLTSFGMSLEEEASLEDYALVPFQAAIQQRVAGVMLSHILYRRLDPQWPASLSKAIARDLLCKQLGFTGVGLTDDLEMGAITRHYGFNAAIRQVLRADIDLALICRSAEKLLRAHALMVRKTGSRKSAGVVRKRRPAGSWR